MCFEIQVFKAVSHARQLIQQDKATPAAAIEIAAKAFGLNDRLVADYVLPAVRACERARELRWRERRCLAPDDTEVPEVSLTGSSLAAFEYFFN